MKLSYVIACSVVALTLSNVAIAQRIQQPKSSDSKSKKQAAAEKKTSNKDDDSASEQVADETAKKLPGRIAASLVLIKSDWSDHKDAEDIKKQLERHLKDVAMPASYREDILKYAPRVLFSEDFVTLYRADDFQALMAWLYERELVKVTEAVTKADFEKEREYEESNASDTDQLLRVVDMFVGEELFPMMHVAGSNRPDPPPFVTYEYGWRWTITSRLKQNDSDSPVVLEVDLARVPQRTATLRVNYNTSVETSNLGGTARLAFDFPADQIAAAHGAFSYSRSAKEAVRVNGWEPIVYMAREDFPEIRDGRPALVKPTVLFQPKSGSTNRFLPRRSRGGSGMFSRAGSGGFGGSSRSGSGSTLGSSSSIKANPEPEQIKIFNLRYVKADEAAKTLKQLLPEQNIVADVRVNSLITRGEGQQIKEVQALVEQLDRPPSDTVKQITGQRIANSKAARETAELLLRDLRGRFESKENQVKPLAKSLAKESDDEQSRRLRDQLTAVVTEAFGLRQDLQRAELGLLHERIRHIESQIEQREALREQIIRHRVKQLIGDASLDNPDERQKLGTSTNANPSAVVMKFNRAPWGNVLSWLAEVNAVPLQLEEEPWGSFSFDSPQQVTMDKAIEIVGEALPREFELVLNEGQLIVRRKRSVSVNPQASDVGVATLRGPSEFRRDMERLKQKISEYEGWRAALKEQDQPSTQYDESLKKANAELGILRAEYDTQVKILELEVTGAKAEFDTAAESNKLAKAIYESGALPAEEMREASLKLEKAKVRLAQAQALLDLYRRVDVENVTLPERQKVDVRSATKSNRAKDTTEKSPNKTPSSGDVQIEALPDKGVIILRGTAEGVESVAKTLEQIGNNRNESAEKPAPPTLKALPE